MVERLRKQEDKRNADLEALKKDRSTVSGERTALEDTFLRSFKSNVQGACMWSVWSVCAFEFSSTPLQTERS